MGYKELLGNILAMLNQQVDDNFAGYLDIQSDYWFGRLNDSEELIKMIEKMLED